MHIRLFSKSNKCIYCITGLVWVSTTCEICIYFTYLGERLCNMTFKKWKNGFKKKIHPSHSPCLKIGVRKWTPSLASHHYWDEVQDPFPSEWGPKWFYSCLLLHSPCHLSLHPHYPQPHPFSFKTPTLHHTQCPLHSRRLPLSSSPGQRLPTCMRLNAAFLGRTSQILSLC